MKKLYLLILLALLPLLASAELPDHYDAIIDGIYYYLNSNRKNATVTCFSEYGEPIEGSYSGDIVIPPSVTDNGVEYSVTSIGDYAFSYCSELTSITIPNSVPRFLSNQRSSLPILKKRK